MTIIPFSDYRDEISSLLIFIVSLNNRSMKNDNSLFSVHKTELSDHA